MWQWGSIEGTIGRSRCRLVLDDKSTRGMENISEWRQTPSRKAIGRPKWDKGSRIERSDSFERSITLLRCLITSAQIFHLKNQ